MVNTCVYSLSSFQYQIKYWKNIEPEILKVAYNLYLFIYFKGFKMQLLGRRVGAIKRDCKIKFKMIVLPDITSVI